MRPVAVVASGMVTAVGFDSPSTCAAIRSGLSAAAETLFIDDGGEPLIGSAVQFETPVRGFEKLVRLIVPAIAECLAAATTIPADEIPLILLLPERGRPGLPMDLERRLGVEVEARLGLRFHRDSVVHCAGRIGIAHGLRAAEHLLHDGGRPACIVAGVDSLLTGPALAALEIKERLLTSRNSNGFIPGEAGTAVLIMPAGRTRAAELQCLGIGWGTEKSTVESEKPLRADGMVEAIRTGLADAGVTYDDLSYRLVDVSGEQYGFKEAALAVGRTLRKVKPTFPIWHPAECVGEVGAAIGPCMLGVALAAARKGYAPGKGALCQFTSDDGARGTAPLHWMERTG